MRVIFVRRGQFSTYNILVERTQLLSDVQVQWIGGWATSGRLRSQSTTPDRRRQDRRRPSSPDVDFRGYTIVDVLGAASSTVTH